jgi:L-lactate dehydrogenase complex protein LldE
MRVMLMRTCLSDLIAPSVAASARTVLERAGVEVAVPRRQTCCGQPAWSAGHPGQALPVARQALRAFRGDDPVVVLPGPVRRAAGGGRGPRDGGPHRGADPVPRP